MWFWWFMLICDLLIPIAMAVVGRMMWKHCPKQINGLFGYRTARSMKNIDTWKFANEYGGRLCWIIGAIMIVPSALIQIPFYHSDGGIIAVVGLVLAAVQCIFLLALILTTERALKKTFNDDGTQR